jgi:arginase family enzyme
MSSYTLAPHDNFGALSEELARAESARAALFLVPLERKATCMFGTRNGPAAMITASRNMETDDVAVGLKLSKNIGIVTLPTIDTQDGPLEKVPVTLHTAGRPTTDIPDCNAPTLAGCPQRDDTQQQKHPRGEKL